MAEAKRGEGRLEPEARHREVETRAARLTLLGRDVLLEGLTVHGNERRLSRLVGLVVVDGS
jgi:hypothetical protein